MIQEMDGEVLEFHSRDFRWSVNESWIERACRIVESLPTPIEVLYRK